MTIQIDKNVDVPLACPCCGARLINYAVESSGGILKNSAMFACGAVWLRNDDCDFDKKLFPDRGYSIYKRNMWSRSVMCGNAEDMIAEQRSSSKAL